MNLQKKFELSYSENGLRKFFSVLIIGICFQVISSSALSSERITFDNDVRNWKKVVLLNRDDQGGSYFASFRVPGDFEIFEDAKVNRGGETVYLKKYSGDVDFVVGSKKCQLGQKEPPSIRCPIITIVYDPGSFNPKLWKSGKLPQKYQSVDTYLEDEKSLYNEEAGAEKWRENLLEFKPYKNTKYRAQEVVRLARMTKGLFGQPLTREVIIFSKNPKLDKILTLGYLEQNWAKKEKIFKEKPEWLYKDLFEKILSTVEFYK